MKTLFYNVFFVLMLLTTGYTTRAQNANTSLSNLTAPTKVNVDLLPNTTNTRSLGSTAKSWKNIFAQNAYFLTGTKFISDAGTANTFIGSNAGNSNTTGNNNTTNGYQTLYSNTTGFANVATGVNTLYYNTTGYDNVANGLAAMYNNSIGYYNVANGYQALFSNTSGYFNVANGAETMYGNTTGSYNTANGDFTLYRNAGNYNTANGTYALYSNTSGTSNTADGESALYNNTTGNYNTASGVGALYYNTTGYYNTANGLDALYENTGGIYNTAVGLDALFWNSTGSYNTAVGNYALVDNSTSQYNTAVGYFAGASYDNGYNNVFLGANTTANGAGYYNMVAVGQATVCTASSQARIGNSFTTSIGGYANWSNISDGRVKKNIKQNVPGLAFINKLKPITYNLDLEASDKITQPPAIKDKDGNQIQPSQQELDARKVKEQIVYTGFIAQDVEKAAKSLNYDFSGVDAAKNDKDLYGLRYSDFVVPLVKAVQELSKMNDDKDAKINDLQNQINELKSMIGSKQLTVSGEQSSVIPSASLEQNIPNPFSNTTIISYTLPQQYSSAQILVTDKSGKPLKQINISGNGKGSVQVDASTLSSGALSIFVDS